MRECAASDEPKDTS